MKWLKRLALVVVAGLAVFVFGWAPYWLAGIATTRRVHLQATRENAGLTPKSFDLPYEDVTFSAPDGVPLKGWWVPAPESRGTVVLVHGLNRSRIEMVKKVPFLHRQGWNALLFDLRHHGESGGAVSSFGFFEKQDVHAATAFARARYAAARRAVGRLPGRGVRDAGRGRRSRRGRPHLRQQLPQPARHGVASPHPVPPLPLVAAHRAHLAGGGRGRVLDRTARPGSIPTPSTSAAPPRTWPAAPACSCATRRTGACRRRSPSS